ncbi:MAG: aminoacyl-tRNA deacylase [Myxococcota bacterium]
MAKKIPSTPALRLLRASAVDFELHPYPYVPRGGTAASAAALGVDEHVVIKTLLFETEESDPVVVLMHGDRSVSTKALARVLEAKSTHACAPRTAERHSGYRVGGTSPFGTRKAMPVIVPPTVLELDRIYINAGARGFLVSLHPRVLVELLAPAVAEVAIIDRAS